MKRNTKIVLLATGTVLAMLVIWWAATRSGTAESVSPGTRVTVQPVAETAIARSEAARIVAVLATVEPESETEDDPEKESAEHQTEEEKREAEEEKLVDAFDNLTDKWTEPSAKGVTMADVDNFAKQFRQVPKERQDECVHRALNLIPDENVMLLAGILMDKSMDKEIVETVFNDILNRDEDVKMPILQQIFKDKSHSCWDDTAWILEVTGELPKDK